MALSIGIVGYGKIAHDQHRPALEASTAFRLAAVADPNTTAENLAQYPDLASMLASEPDLDAIAVCVPPQFRRELAATALAAGKHVLLEKPPGATLGEVADLAACAARAGRTLLASWHSRHAPAVAPAQQWLSDREIRRVHIDWQEDVRIYHPGQAWIWAPGGLGVFDPGINALSILTRLLPQPIFVTQASLSFPENCATPIAAELELGDARNTPMTASMNFRHEGDAAWTIDIETDAGHLRLSRGGAHLAVDGHTLVDSDKDEYSGVYAHFARLIEQGESDIDVRPFTLVADAMLLGRREIVAPFHDDG